jgi:hypothetical protein
VTVEASSDALIERVRSVVTDGTGQYRIIDLRPGTYAVTFTLAGFATVQREGIELAGSGTATINVELRVGAISETLTVTERKVLRHVCELELSGRQLLAGAEGSRAAAAELARSVQCVQCEPGADPAEQLRRLAGPDGDSGCAARQDQRAVRFLSALGRGR